ncbi:Tim44 domain-containing protein [Aliishimia ponticola]|uniref:Tim44 domain-containing protein n=1 Tax=Aliishimia ponticola TaxID=2499833 RepID=A0A4S4N982_9RHOB|nr:Tim44/TimA family putative adaptor protein [Aliishimia ponticola]THH34638.1 Tim44 domain-containing protein [Aliishimia ponticola]
MNSPILQLLVLAGIAVFLILRLRNVLGTRDGFEPSERGAQPVERSVRRPEFEVIEGGPDRDILDHVQEGNSAADALRRMKEVEPSFSVGEFIGGARGAYEMIVMGFENSELSEIKPFLAPEIYEAFAAVVEDRQAKGLKIEAEFIGVREVRLLDASFDDSTNEAEISIRFVAEMTSAVRDSAGDIIEGSTTEVKRQKDSWAFARKMGSDDPNWLLVSTDA